MKLLFLETLRSVVKKHSMIHLYQFAAEDEFSIVAENIVEKCFQLGFRCSVVGIVKAGQSAPRTYRICIDLEIK